MTTDWASLTPHAPVRPGGVEYVERPGGAGEVCAKWVLAGRSTVLLGGPAGVGKSTELAHAAMLLQPHRVSCLVPLDRWANMRRLAPGELLQRISLRVASVAKETLNLAISQELLDESQKEVSDRWTPEMLVQLVLTEVARRSKQRRIALLLDGLEKVPEGTGALELFDALAGLPSEVDLVAVIPWHAAFGPQAETVIRAGEKFVSARAIALKGPAQSVGYAFLRSMLLRRLQLPDVTLERLHGPFDPTFVARLHVVNHAAEMSGGIPRIFLQLMADAASYAKLGRGGDWPTEGDLADACADQVDTFRRLFLPGDADAAILALGTDGRELELPRKVRLMAHGILLEREQDHVPVLEMHPLAHLALKGGGARA